MSKNAAGEIPATGRPARRRPTHPGVILLKLFLREIPMSQAEAARRMNMPVTRVNDLVRGKRDVTARSALRLGRLLGNDAHVLDEPPVQLGPLARAAGGTATAGRPP